MTKRILLLGKTGQVGWELQRSLAPLGFLIAHDRVSCDLADLANLFDIVDAHRPDVIVNAAAFTAVDRAETEQDLAYRINAEAVAILAKAAAKNRALLVHYSTDYVFDGAKSSAYVESDIANPLSIYGKSKLQGERAILDSGCAHVIFRTSWVFSARGNNFVRTMLRLALTHQKLRVIADQWGSPTSAELIADVTAHAIHNTQPGHSGIYHLAASGETNWHEYASFVINRAATMGASVKTTVIEAIATNEFPLPAKRPANSRLNCAKLEETFDFALPHWQYYVERMLAELTLS